MLSGCQHLERELESRPPRVVVGVGAQVQVRQVVELGHPRELEFGQSVLQIAVARLVNINRGATLLCTYRFVDEE